MNAAGWNWEPPPAVVVTDADDVSIAELEALTAQVDRDSRPLLGRAERLLRWVRTAVSR